MQQFRLAKKKFLLALRLLDSDSEFGAEAAKLESECQLSVDKNVKDYASMTTVVGMWPFFRCKSLHSAEDAWKLVGGGLSGPCEVTVYVPQSWFVNAVVSAKLGLPAWRCVTRCARSGPVLTYTTLQAAAQVQVQEQDVRPSLRAPVCALGLTGCVRVQAPRVRAQDRRRRVHHHAQEGPRHDEVRGGPPEGERQAHPPAAAEALHGRRLR